MNMSKLPLLSALSEKMRWHQVRQGILAENVANAETPGFAGRDLKTFNFADHMRGNSKVGLSTMTTSASHISSISTHSAAFGAQEASGFDVTPDRNGVNLEGQMMKVAGNQMDFQAATTLYTRSVRILKTALGR